MTDYYDGQRKDYTRFLRDTQNHQMTIRQDDGLHRHITMADPKRSAYHFNITTFPGYLVYTGDMGSYVFSRLRDMFEFHRIDWERETPTIDYDYWAQKCEAKDRSSGTEEFDEDHFREAALKAFWNHDWPDHKTRRDEWEFSIRDIISAGHQSTDEALHAMMGYSYTRWKSDAWGSSHEETRPFDDFYEYGSFTRPCLRLRWACWAIAYTIRCYDLGGDRFNRQAAHDELILSGKL